MDHDKRTRSANDKPVSTDKLKKDPSLQMQEYLNRSSSAEETLFKINELLYGGEHSEMRRYVRAPISIPVIFKIGDNAFKSSTYTVSEKGMFIKSPDPPSTGTAVEVEFEMPDDGPPILARGEVVQSATLKEAMERTSLSGMSVTFTKISKEDRQRIDFLVQAYSRKMGKSGG